MRCQSLFRVVEVIADVFMLQAPKKTKTEETKENVTLGPSAREGEHVFGVAHIFASFNDTFVVCTQTSMNYIVI